MWSSTVSKRKSSADRWRDDISHVSAKWFSNGCCGQSLVFPRRIVPRLADWFRRVKDGHADRRIEEFAEHACVIRICSQCIPAYWWRVFARGRTRQIYLKTSDTA